jgi:hypothetical protein
MVSSIWGESTEAQSDKNLIRTAKTFWKILGTKTTRTLMSGRTSQDRYIPETWLYNYLWNFSTRNRAHDTVRLKVEPSSEISLVINARKRVIRELSRRQICIESNPTSNLVVAGLDAVAAQTALHHRFSSNEKSPKYRLPWTISTDDPISFSTTLADEYAYAWAGMVLEYPDHCEPCDARALLDEAAATSMRMRFAIPHNGRNRLNEAERGNYHHAYRG